MIQRHNNSSEWIQAESIRLYPLDLCKRIDWLYAMAGATLNEDTRHCVYGMISTLRNGVTQQ